MKHGAVGTDCCSGLDDGKVCLKSKCSEVGHKLLTGEHCCSDVKDAKGVCKCLAPGSSIPADATARACCSGRLDGDKKCDILRVGETPNMDITDASVCSSGKVDSHGKCACVHDGSKSKEASECCAKSLAADGKCSCMPNGQGLHGGAVEVDCCSRYTEKNSCACAPPGFPSRPTHKGAECCSGSSQGGFCGCFGPGKVKVAAHTQMCCGGFINTTSPDECGCIRAGTNVAKYVHDGACCSGGVNGEFVCK